MRRTPRLILVALAGHTPAVITESLWVLEQRQGQPVDEIRVITTTSGARQLAARLWGPEGHFTRYCQDYRVAPGRIAFGPAQVYIIQDHQALDLDDIRTHPDNTAAADQIFARIREWTARPDEVLHGSVAGGRKTMGIYLTMAFMLCARPQDSLSHVLVNPEFELGVQDFYYPPPQPRQYQRTGGPPLSSDAAGVELAEVPFLRLRDLAGEHLPLDQGFLAALEHAQALCRCLTAPPELQVCLHCGRVQLGELGWRLSKQQLAVYVLFLTDFNAPTPQAGLADLLARRARLAELEGQIDDLRLGARESYAWDALNSLEDLQEKLTPIISKINRTLEAALGANEVSRRLAIQRRPYGVDVPRFAILLDHCPHC
jgi:CRISPR-associated protein (TIGR02584 family)